MNQTRPISRYSGKKKWVLILLFTSIFLLVGSYLLLSVAENRAEQALLELINNELSDKSEVVIGQFKLTLFPLGFTADEIELLHHTPFNEKEIQKESLDAVRNLNIETVSAKKFRLWSYLRHKTIHIDEVKITGATVELISVESERETDDDSSPKSTPVYISEFHLLDSSLNYFQNPDTETPTFYFEKTTIYINEIDFSELDDQPYPLFTDLEMQVQKLGYRSENKHYKFEFDSLQLNSLNRDFRFKNMQVTPLLTATEMADEMGYQLDRFDASLAQFLMIDFDLKSLIFDGKLTAAKVELVEPEVHIDRDQSYPRRDREEDRILPHIQFINLEFPIQVDTVHAIDGTLRYLEFYPDENREGYVLFDHIDLKAFPFQNISVEDSLFVRAKTSFMNVSELNLNIDFSLKNDAAHIVSGRLAPMDLTTINDPLDGLILMRLESGELDRLNFWFYADNEAAAGNLMMIYNDLEVQFLDDELTSDRNMDQLKSFIANTFAIRSNNSSDDPRTGDIEYERDPERSMFNYWLRSLATGLEETIKRF